MQTSSELQCFSTEKGAMITQGKCEPSGHLPEAPTLIAFGLWDQETRGTSHTHSLRGTQWFKCQPYKWKTQLPPLQRVASVRWQQKHHL